MNSCHVLIVDDVVENIQVAMHILAEDDYALSFSTSGEEAYQIIRENAQKLDLILLDVIMPGLDGFQLCELLQQQPDTSSIPIIFVTAKSDVDSIRRGFELGAVDYITKPFHPSELLARTRTHTQLYQAKRLLESHNIALQTKVKREKKRLLTELEDNQKEMIVLLSNLMESASAETGQHIRRVAQISALLAFYHPVLTMEDMDTLFHASPMHDIGKMMVPTEILHKPGKYEPEEFEIMKEHTSNAYDILKYSERKLFKAAAIVAHQHHEKWDGSGYPQKLEGEEIHLYGRIVALADVFDALTHSRCYKEAWEINDAVSYIRDLSGTQFDPELVDIFLNHLEEFVAIVADDG